MSEILRFTSYSTIVVQDLKQQAISSLRSLNHETVLPPLRFSDSSTAITKAALSELNEKKGAGGNVHESSDVILPGRATEGNWRRVVHEWLAGLKGCVRVSDVATDDAQKFSFENLPGCRVLRKRNLV